MEQKVEWKACHKYNIITQNGESITEYVYTNQFGCEVDGGVGISPDGSFCGECNGKCCSYEFLLSKYGLK